jgi:hypothetical protein
MADGPDCRAADLAHTFSNIVRHCKNLIAVLVKQEMVVAKMRAAHVPVKVLGFHIKRECVCQQSIERSRNVFDRFRFNV